MSTAKACCDFCNHTFATVGSLKRHQPKCTHKQLETLRNHYESQLETLHEQIRLQQEKIDKLENQIFEIAKQPTTIHNTSTHQRILNIVHQLAPYDLEPDKIQEMVDQYFTAEVFRGGPDEIAKMTAEFLLTDPESKKPKVACTDASRRTFRYITSSDTRPQVDAGFQKTHGIIRRPLKQANYEWFDQLQKNTDDPFDTLRSRFYCNDDFIANRSQFTGKVMQFMP